MEQITAKIAKVRLDDLINKQRISFYKPTQIAEILYHVRNGTLKLNDLGNLDKYRNNSKRWRDDVSERLIKRVSTSSQGFQDDLFRDVMPPEILHKLAEENGKLGVVERYIYQKFWEKQKMVLNLLKQLKEAKKENFCLDVFLDSFYKDSGMKKSVDKAFEIIVYALFNSLLTKLEIKSTIQIDDTKKNLLIEFKDFTNKVIGLDSKNVIKIIKGKIFRVGVTNAADGGIDMLTNFGPLIQVKHLTLDYKMVEDISKKIESDDIIIVCLDAEKDQITGILNQIGQKINSIITKNELCDWYEKALRGNSSDILGDFLILNLKAEFEKEFTFSTTLPAFFKERGYGNIVRTDSIFWMDVKVE